MKSLVTFISLFVFGYASAQTGIFEKGTVHAGDGILPDFSFAGYRQGNVPLPNKIPDVFVTDYGAKGDGKTDCTAAFKRALKESAGKTIGIPKGVYLLSDRLVISAANTVLLGAGMDETILFFTKGLQEIEPTQAFTGGGFETNKWSWSGGVITLGSSSGTRKSPRFSIATPAKRGARQIELADTSDLKPGMDCLIQVADTSNTLIDYLYRGRPGDISLLKDKRFAISQAVTVASVDGKKITLRQPLRFDLRAEWKPVIYRIANDSQEIGIADFTIRFPVRPYRGHWREDGMNGFAMQGANNWARNIRIENCDSGIFLKGTWCTIDGLFIETNRQAYKNGITGHHGVTFSGRECLLSNFSLGTKFFHDVTVSNGSVGNVFSNGRAQDMSIDHHRRAPYENLFTQIDVGLGTRVWSSGGTRGLGLHTASGATFWNITSKEKFSLPSESFGPPGLIFAGLNLKPTKISDLPDGWYYDESSPPMLLPQNLYLFQLEEHRTSQAPQNKK